MTLSRRTLLASSSAALSMASFGLSGCEKQGSVSAPSTSQSAGKKASIDHILKQATDLLVTSYPETASSAGIDKGEYAPLKGKLTDRTPAGQAAIEANIRTMASKLGKIDATSLSAGDALNLDVIRSVFEQRRKGLISNLGIMRWSTIIGLIGIALILWRKIPALLLRLLAFLMPPTRSRQSRTLRIISPV